MAAGAVKINGKVVRASRLPERRELVEVEFPDAEPPRTLAPNPLHLDVVYEDEELAVIDKPAGLVVHPAPGHWDDTLVNALAARGTSGGGGAPGRPGIVHRLDRDTSGLMLLSRTDDAHRKLSSAMAARTIRRAYAALAWGHFDAPRSTIEGAIGRHQADRKRMAIRPDGRTARTDVEVVSRLDVCDLVRLTLHTGRTHQIRVHLQHAGHPVVGDAVYHGGGSRRMSGVGRASADALERVTPRQALHSAFLSFKHPATGRVVECRSEWPSDLAASLAAALPSGLVAGAEPLSYLGFFGHD